MASDQASGQSVNPFVCNVCQKTYGRIDHLARHFRSHTNEKPFRCQDCPKTFARADLLKRHATLHTSTEVSGKKRKIRASQACTACATIKVKCDQEKPCKRCVAKGIECRVEANTYSSAASIEDEQSPTESISRRPHSRPVAPFENNLRRPTPHFESSTNIRSSYTTTNQQPHPLEVQPSLIDFLAHVVHSAMPSNHSQSRSQPQLPSQQHHQQPRQPLLQQPPLPQPQPAQSLPVTWNGQFEPRNLMDFNQDLSIDFNDLDAALSGTWDHWLDPTLATAVDNTPVTTSSDISTPSIDDSIQRSSAAYSRSAWRWVPSHGRGNEDHAITSVLVGGHSSGQPHKNEPMPLVAPLSSVDRDRMVALLLATCEKTNYQNIVSGFPKASILNIFLNDFLLYMEHAIDSWMHIPTFDPAQALPELLTIMVAGGATLSKVSQTQRLGYALQDKARLAIHEMWETDIFNTRNLQSLQAFATQLELGIWSGNKRTMEMAEASIYPLTTMIRRQGGFRRSRGVAAGPSSDDTSDILEQKWRTWIEAESFKRLAYHIFILCVQVSIAFQTPPLLSYAEITLELPAPSSVWRARTAEEWRDEYRAHDMHQPLPTFVSVMCDANIMGSVRDRIDLQLTLYLVLLSHWLLAWEYTQLSSANKAQASSQQWAGTTLASSKCQELRRLLDSFYVAIEGWKCFVPKEVHMTSQLLRMNLCVAFEDLQLVAGKEGEEEARRVLPSLKQWFRSPECREALLHAGQVLRAARRPEGTPVKSRYPTPSTPWLRDFHAVALYHAGLTFWSYSLLARTIAFEEDGASDALDAHTGALEDNGPVIRLDGDDAELSAIDRHGFIGLNKGRPVISATSPFILADAKAQDVMSLGNARTEALRASRGPNTEAVVTQTETLPLDDPKAIMEVIIEALTPTSQPPEFGDQSASPNLPQRPAMVENLVQLLRDLGEAASVV